MASATTPIVSAGLSAMNDSCEEAIAYPIGGLLRSAWVARAL